MSQIFHRSTTTFSRVTIFGAVFAVAGFFGVLGLLARSPYETGVGALVDQPVQFSHRHGASNATGFPSVTSARARPCP